MSKRLIFFFSHCSDTHYLLANSEQLSQPVTHPGTKTLVAFHPTCSDSGKARPESLFFRLEAQRSDRPSRRGDPTGEPGSASWVAQISCYRYKHRLMFRLGAASALRFSPVIRLLNPPKKEERYARVHKESMIYACSNADESNLLILQLLMR